MLCNLLILEVIVQAKAKGSITDSIKQHEAASSERRPTVPKIDTRNVTPQEDVLYVQVCV